MTFKEPRLLKGSRNFFKVAYYHSSFLFTYLFIMGCMVFVDSGTYQKNNYFISARLAFILTLFLLMYSYFCLVRTKVILSSVRKAKNTLGSEKITIKRNYDHQLKDILFTTVLPILLDIPFIKSFPLVAVAVLVLYQICIGVYFSQKVDIFFNISLLLFGYSLFIGVKGTNKRVQERFVFGQRAKILKNHSYTIIRVGDPKYSNILIGLIYYSNEGTRNAGKNKVKKAKNT